MPNTLAHLGVQAFTTRTVVRGADLKWIFLGCVVPDLPWITRRIIATVAEGDLIYDSMLYATLQASLLSCLLLSACLAAFSDRSLRVFAILASASLIHLLLDALQIKWGNGVLLLAPYSMSLFSFELFWPEQWPSMLMNAFGIGYVAWAFFRIPPSRFDLRIPRGTALLTAVVGASAYLLGPLVFMDAAERADPLFVHTVRDIENRTGREAFFDRSPLIPGKDGSQLRVFRSIAIDVQGVDTDERALVSTKGRFIDNDSYEITQIYYHFGRSRDILVYLGLFSVVALWLRDIGWQRLKRVPGLLRGPGSELPPP